MAQAASRSERRLRLARNGLSAIRGGRYLSTWCGLTKDDASDLIEDLRRLGEEQGVPPFWVEQTVDAIKANNLVHFRAEAA